MVTHFREYWLFGLFFAIVTPLQVLWAGLAFQNPTNTRLLKIGAIGNLAIVGIWVVSRTIGLPFGPEALEAEGIGVKDLVASWDEVLIGVLVLVALTWTAGRRGPRWLIALGWTVAVVSMVLALIADNGH
mgnify:CR=1 FL=1